MPTTSQRCRQLVSAVCLQYRGAVIACTFVLLAMVGIASWSLAPRTNRLATLRGPLTRAELGHATWSLLHTMAAKFPDNATSAQQNDYRQFMHLLARLYPCHECAGHFQELLSGSPPDVRSGDAFRKWLCVAHNVVRRRLDQTESDCSADHLSNEWPSNLAGEDCGCTPPKYR
ncbi:Sulfhydryl oxidase [Plasmodiophora brassicae]